MNIVYGIVIALNLTLGIIKKQSKVLSFFSLGFIWILLWGRTSGHDYYAYFNEYQTGRFMDKSQLLYNFIISICKKIGLSYYQYLAIWALIIIIIASLLVKNLSLNWHLLIALYCLYPLLFDMIQVSNFIALFFFMTSVICYIKEKKLVSYVMLACCVFIHTAFVFYIPFFFLLNRDFSLKKHVEKILIIITAINSIITLSLGKNLNWLYQLLSIVTEDKRVDVYTSTTTNLGFLLYYFLVAVGIFAIYKSKQVISDYHQNNIVDKNLLLFANMLYSLNMYSILILPLCMGNSNFFRYYRNLSFMNAICISNSFTIYGGKNIKIKHTAVLLTYILLMTVFMKADISSFSVEMIGNVLAFN